MKKIGCLLACCMMLLSVVAVATAQEPITGTADYDLSVLSDDELLALWTQAGQVLQERGAYPTVELAKGDQGNGVTRLQQRLADLYYYTGGLTGKYDDTTVKAVKAFEKANGIKGDGKMSIDEQDLLYSNEAAPKATPTSRPSPTPAPTPVPDNAALEITSVSLRDRYNTKVFSLKLKNRSAHTIDAFTVAHRCYDSYGTLLSGGLFNTSGIEYAEWWKDLSLKPGKSFSTGGYFWYLFGYQTCARIEVAVSKYHTTDGNAITVSPEDYVWVTGEL